LEGLVGFPEVYSVDALFVLWGAGEDVVEMLVEYFGDGKLGVL